MMKETVNCDICYPNQAHESASPVRKKKETARSPDRSTTCNFAAQYDAGRDTRRRHRRQYEVKQVTCQKCRPTASSSEDITSAKARFWRRARKPDTEDKGIGYSWSKRSFANMRNFLHKPCKWCRDYKDTSSQCANVKKDDVKAATNKPFPPIQTRTLTVMTDRKMTRDKSALMNLPTIKEDCAVQTRSKGISKSMRLKSYDINDSAVGPSHVGDNIVQKERTKKPQVNRKMPGHDAAIEQANIGDNAVVDLYNKDIQSSDDSDDKRTIRKRDAKIANKRCGIWNIQFLTHAKHYPAIRLEISPRQTMNKLGDANPKISRETAKENIISWFDYKNHSKSTLRSKKHVTTQKRTITTQFRGIRNYIVNHCTGATDVVHNRTEDKNSITEASTNEVYTISTISESGLSRPSGCDYTHNIQSGKYASKTNDQNLFRKGNFQSKVDVYQLFTNFKDSASTINKIFSVSSISLFNAKEVDVDSQRLYNSLVLQTPDKELGFDNANNIEDEDSLSDVNTLESDTYIILSESESLNNILQNEDLKMAVLDLYAESELSNNSNEILRFPKRSSRKRIVKRIRKKLE